ncbi:MAG: DegV family protein [Candidatus Heimdallarchaeota archaeon]|nr:DegV family protein [Candidatus Heimdallarchaeota archaeon]
MSKIKIITDSTSDIPIDLAKKYDIDIVPLNIFFGDEKFKDGESITAKDVYKRITTEKTPWPSTSQPSAREFLEYYNKAFDKGYETIISIHITPNMSGTLNSVNIAKQMLPDKDLVVIDSNTVTHPLGLVVYETAKLVKEGKDKQSILATLKNNFVPKANICGMVETLEFLHRGGRIGRAKKVLGTLLKKKPVLEVTEGSVNSFGTVTGFEEGYEKFVALAPKIFDNLIAKTVWLGYANDITRTDDLYKAIKDLPNAPKELREVEIGPTVGVHIGPGSLTIAWLGNWDNNWFYGKY